MTALHMILVMFMGVNLYSLQYLAGFFDGEGSIFVTPAGGRYPVYVSISNTYKPVLDEFARRFGGKVILGRQKENYKQIYLWCITTNKALACIRTLRPYLIEKAPQAWLALEYWEQRTRQARTGRSDEELALREGYRLALQNSKRLHFGWSE